MDSYGFAVAVPEHPNSNSEQLRSLLAGRTNVVTKPREFIDRPLDVKYLLDVLEKRYGSKLNLQQVGVIGRSFGGYTALALAGASLNFEQLQKDCGEIDAFLNISLLLQCRAIELPQMQYNLRDPRIKAAIAKRGRSPIAKSDPNPDPLQIPSEMVGSDIETEIARRYLKALSVAFLTTYVKNSPKLRPYLSADYAQNTSQSTLPLQLLQSLPIEKLTQNFQ